MASGTSAFLGNLALIWGNCISVYYSQFLKSLGFYLNILQLLFPLFFGFFSPEYAARGNFETFSRSGDAPLPYPVTQISPKRLDKICWNFLTLEVKINVSCKLTKEVKLALGRSVKKLVYPSIFYPIRIQPPAPMSNTPYLLCIRRIYW